MEELSFQTKLGYQVSNIQNVRILFFSPKIVRIFSLFLFFDSFQQICMKIFKKKLVKKKLV